MAESTGYRTFLYCFENERLRVVCPVAERPIGDFADLVTPYGFSGFVGTQPCPGFAEHWWRFAESSGYVCAYLVLNPVLTDASYFAGVAKRHRTVYTLDLSLGEHELFARLSTNRRRQVRRAERHPEVFVRDRERLSEFFVRVYPEFMKRHAAADVYRLSDRSLTRLCESPDVVMVGAQQDGEIVAVSLFGATGYCGDFLYNVSVPGGEAHSAPLIWEGARALVAAGVPVLNLGGGVVEGDSLAMFKERFRGEARPLESVQQVYRPDVYESLCEMADVSSAAGGYFPAYRSSRVSAS